MKKITDNTFWGKLTLILNVLLLVFFILSMIFLMRFDKTNKAVVYERAAYDKTYENFIMAQHPLKQDSAEVAYYQYKLDTLKQKTAATRDEKKTLADAIEVTKNTLSEKQKTMDTHLEEAPTFTPATGTSDTLINVTIACSEPSAIISYSLNGAANQVYTGPIVLNTPGTYTITAQADGMYWLQSNQVTATYTVTAPAPPAPVETPVISPNSGFSYDPVQVTITCPTQGASIYYTTNGTEPTTASTLYTAPFTLSATATVKAKAFLAGHDASGVVSATY